MKVLRELALSVGTVLVAVCCFVGALTLIFIFAGWLPAQTRADLAPTDAHATILGAKNIVEQPTNQTGDTWDVNGHNRAYALKVWRSGALLRPAVGYEESWPDSKTVRIKLATPLQPGEWVAWEKWTP